METFFFISSQDVGESAWVIDELSVNSSLIIFSP